MCFQHQTKDLKNPGTKQFQFKLSSHVWVLSADALMMLPVNNKILPKLDMGRSMGLDRMHVRVLRVWKVTDGDHEIAGKLAKLLFSKVGNGSKSNGNQSQTEFPGDQYWAQSYLISFSIIWKIGINTSSSLQVTQKLGKQIDPPKMSLCTEIVTGWKTEPFQETH